MNPSLRWDTNTLKRQEKHFPPGWSGRTFSFGARKMRKGCSRCVCKLQSDERHEKLFYGVMLWWGINGNKIIWRGKLRDEHSGSEIDINDRFFELEYLLHVFARELGSVISCWASVCFKWPHIDTTHLPPSAICTSLMCSVFQFEYWHIN